MFRDDREAMARQLDALDREAETLRSDNAAIREQLLAVRRVPAAAQPALDVYRMELSRLDAGYQAALRKHELRSFPVLAMAVLNIVTLGLFPLIYLGLCHDRLPRALDSDPSGGRAIGFTFIPYFNLYWVFFNSLRLADRINLQFKLRGLTPMVPRGLVLASAIVSVIPYVNILIGIPLLWTVTVCFYQRAINRLVASG